MNFLIEIIVGLLIVTLIYFVFKRKPNSLPRKIGKYFLLILLGISLISDVVISYQNYQDLPKKVMSLKDISLGDSKSDVVFKVGKLETRIERAYRILEENKKNIKTESERVNNQLVEEVVLNRIEELKKENNTDLVPIDESKSYIRISLENNKVNSIFYTCEQSDISEINGIYCGSSGNLIKEKYGNDVKILCSKDGDETQRTYDLPKYNVRYYLTQNSVDGFYVGHPEEDIKWIQCK